MCEQTAPIIKETIDEIERVDAMLRALLQYARPEKAHAEVLDPVAEIQAVLTFMLQLLERDGIRIDTQMSSSPLRVYIDRARLRQVILNLLTNSVEATGPHGYIRISVVPHDQAVAINVADSGSGVPVAAREKIFEPFYSSKELGTGLGLALVKRFVEEAGGSVRCHSAPEGGAEFRVTLPASRETDESARQPRAIAQAGAAELADASST